VLPARNGNSCRARGPSAAADPGPPLIQALKDIEPVPAGFALLIGLAGGLVAKWLGLPLPMLLGSLIAVGAAAIGGLSIGGIAPRVPVKLRDWFIPVIGLSIGSAFSPGIFEQAVTWWPSVIALLVYLPAAHLISFTLARRLSGIDRVTAFYGCAPGGFIEAVTLGEEAGADPAVLAMLQFMRLVLTIVLVPLLFTILTGSAVGSAGGMVIGTGAALSAAEWAMMAAAGVIGVVAGKAIRLPAALVTGPIILSGAIHLVGWVEGGVPGWLIQIVQLFVGITLGIRFLGRSPIIIVAAAKVSAVAVFAVLCLAGVASALLSGLVGERWEAVFLAYAPGGLAEMTLIALSLETSVIFVSLHHVLRIILTVVQIRLLAPRFAT